MLKEPRIAKSKLKAHSKFIVSLGMCAAKGLHGVDCVEEIQSCHVRYGFYCMSRKPQKRELPMCFAHHLRQHSIGEPIFWGDKLEDAILLCEELWDITGDVESGQFLVTDFVRN